MQFVDRMTFNSIGRPIPKLDIRIADHLRLIAQSMESTRSLARGRHDAAWTKGGENLEELRALIEADLDWLEIQSESAYSQHELRVAIEIVEKAIVDDSAAGSIEIEYFNDLVDQMMELDIPRERTLEQRWRTAQGLAAQAIPRDERQHKVWGEAVAFYIEDETIAVIGSVETASRAGGDSSYDYGTVIIDGVVKCAKLGDTVAWPNRKLRGDCLETFLAAEEQFDHALASERRLAAEWQARRDAISALIETTE
ncbi:MAG: hypothetical protein AAF456_00680 [Planctomycetota bacterium]